MVEADRRVAELTDEIDRFVLPGPRKRVTNDVITWGERHDRNLTGDRLLEAYNHAVDVSIAQARSALERYASDPSTKPILFTLLSEPRATDVHRQIALDALAGRLERADLGEFGRVNARQRPRAVDEHDRALVAAGRRTAGLNDYECFHGASTARPCRDAGAVRNADAFRFGSGLVRMGGAWLEQATSCL